MSAPEPFMQVKETHVNATEKQQVGDTGWYESPYAHDPSELYHQWRQDYGRCTGHVYVDVKDAENRWSTKAVGWIFVSREPYDDDPQKTYLREMWCEYRWVTPCREAVAKGLCIAEPPKDERKAAT